MILATHGIISGQVSQFDADYQRVLSYGSSLGYTLPSSSQRILQNQLVIDLKAAGIWNKLDSFAVYATDGSRNYALIDWKRLIEQSGVNTPTFTTNQGFQGDGTSSYIDTNFNHVTNSINYTLNNASRFMWNRIAATQTSELMDGMNQNAANSANSLFGGSGANHRINANVNFVGGNVLLNNAGLISINRTSSTNIELFTNSTQFSRTATSTALSNFTQFIIRGGNNFNNQQVSVYGLGASLVSENTALRTALDNYLTNILL